MMRATVSWRPFMARGPKPSYFLNSSSTVRWSCLSKVMASMATGYPISRPRNWGYRPGSAQLGPGGLHHLGQAALGEGAGDPGRAGQLAEGGGAAPLAEGHVVAQGRGPVLVGAHPELQR